MSTRDDDAQLITALERELHRLRCEYRRVCDDLDWSHEQVRVLRRVIERLIQQEEERDRPTP